ncbi:WD domain, G-beta repeat protein, partial [Teladorsagia circumcincta]
MSAVGDERSDKRMELERKKQKLAEMREARRRADEEKKRQLLASVPVENGVTKQSLTSTEVQELLAEVGIPTEPRLEKTPERTNGLSDSDYHLSPMASQIMAGSRSLQLEFSNVHSVAIPTKDAAQYSKTTQTDDDRVSMGEFSTGSQEFDYDDDMLPMDGGGFRDRVHSHDVDSPMTDDLAGILPNIPGFNFAKHKEEPETVKEEPAPVRIPDLSEEEKNQIVASQGFQTFFNYAAKVIERALAEAENVDIFIDYARDGHGEVIASSDRLVLSRVFSDPKWSQNRAVTGIAFSEQHPELVAVSYDFSPLSTSAHTHPVYALEVIGTHNAHNLDPKLRFSFESHNDYVFDVAWSPVHPAVFTSIDAEGNLFLWNLNEDIEGPVARMNIAQDGFLKKIAWAENGQHLCVGDDQGNLQLFDVHESMYVLRSEEWTRFARVLADMKQANEEADEMSEVMSRLSDGIGGLGGGSTVASLAG